MMVRVDKAWGDDLALAIDDRGALGRLYILPNLRNQVPRDENVGILEGGHIIIVPVVENRSALEKDT